MTMDSTVLSRALPDARGGSPAPPLTGAEIQTAATIVTESDYATPTLKFVMIQLAEPEKNAQLTYQSMTDVPRRAFCTMYDAAAKLIYESVVDIGARVVESWKAIPGRFPSYLVEHMTGVEEV